MTNQAIQDPRACCSDDTLIAFMVLNIIDKLLCIADQRGPSEAHLLGTCQLIRLRRGGNFDKEGLQRILAGVYSEIVERALAQRVPINEVPGGFCSSMGRRRE